MTEKESQPALIEVRDVLEGMSPLELRAYKIRMLHEISDRENLVFHINEVLDNYGAI